MNEFTIMFTEWVYLHFGRTGQICVVFIIIGILAGAFWLLK